MNSAESSFPLRPDPRSYPIIVADDDPDVRALICTQLRRAGHRVIPCSNGLEALNALRDIVSGIVLADWLMPEMDGLELCRAVRALSAEDALGFVFFVLLTGNCDKKHVVKGLEAGADEYVVKPYNEQELLARLAVGERVLSLQRQLRERQIELHKANTAMAVLNRHLQRLATTDELTRLSNRRDALSRLEAAWTLAERHGRDLSCIMLDIDDFKRFNDSRGHHAGDAVLRAVGAQLKEILRTSDTAGRLGGEEFILILPETPLRGAAALAERIRIEVERSEIKFNGASLTVTLSAGVAGREPRLTTPEALVAAADAALYVAKQAGRNRVVVSGTQVTAELQTTGTLGFAARISPSSAK